MSWMTRLACLAGSKQFSIKSSYQYRLLLNGSKPYLKSCRYSAVTSNTTISQYEQTIFAHNKSSQGLARLIEAYRNHGHKIANINPLHQVKETMINELNPEFYGLSPEEEICGEKNQKISVGEVIKDLKAAYCGQISLETSTMDCPMEIDWLTTLFISSQSNDISKETKTKICKLMLESQSFDKFLATKFPTLKRYGAEGAESMFAFFHQLFHSFSESDVQQVFVGKAHRGRNNFLACQLQYPLNVMFRKIKGLSEFPEEVSTIATGDVLSHLNVSTKLDMGENKKLQVNLLANPSFLEAVNPVAAGKCRGRQQTLEEPSSSRGLYAACVTVHGDASFSGQGIVMECFNMSKLPGFDVGGVIHFIINNQLGFTTPSELGRSSRYSSDVGKVVGCPVIHVNGDEPELVAKAAEIAVKYREKYRKDIIVDMLCYRRWGHNEMDDPTFTQPLMYDVIHVRNSVPDMYADKLVKADILESSSMEKWKEDNMSDWNALLKECDRHIPEPSYLAPNSPWGEMVVPAVDHVTTWHTGCHKDELLCIGAKSVEVHNEFDMHNHLQKSHAQTRMKKLQSSDKIDWALAETLAFGSLLNRGDNIRLCGEDVGRGTFSHRHAMFTCQKSGEFHIPLNHMHENQKAQIEVVNSLLSEEAVTGFEYGMSIENPNRLVIWEAQFGDFFTGAQIIFDTFITCGEAKWMYQSGIVILLPHGYDGAGPEHSSCRVERFLQSTNSSEDSVDGDGVNISVCHPTTPAQYFHLLRRQMIRNFRKPLIVASPKMLLRHSAAMSPLKDFEADTHFHPVIGDAAVNDPQTVKKVILCSGKHCYALEQERLKLIKSGELGVSDTAIVKLEELCPFPTSDLQKELSKFSSAQSYVWSQEEPRNMGAWSFVSPRFQNLLGIKLKFAGRIASSAAAVGIASLHRDEILKLMKETFA